MEEVKPKSKRVSCLGLILIISLIGIVFASISTPSSKKTNLEPSKETKEVRKQTKAKVNFTGTTFVITNINDYDWQRAEIIVNEKYRYGDTYMKAYTAYEIGAGQFTDSKNYRFNPFEIKPSEIRVYVKDPPSDDWYGELGN